MEQHVKVGDRVVVYGWSQYPTHITRIYWEDNKGQETDIEALATTVRLELEWLIDGQKSKSKVKLHDEGKTWYRYSTAS